MPPTTEPPPTEGSALPSLFANLKIYRYEEFEDPKAQNDVTDSPTVVTAVAVPRGRFMDLPTEIRHKIYDLISEPSPKGCGRLCFSKTDHITEVLPTPKVRDFHGSNLTSKSILAIEMPFWWCFDWES
jgi:hypothetical protein